MTFYAQLLRTQQLLLKKKRYFKHIARNLHFLCVSISTIETRFYPDSKPEENTERLLKGPKVTAFVAFNARHGLLGLY